MIPPILLIGSAIQFWGGLDYLKDTLQGKNQPNRVTWLMWTIAPAIGTVAALTEGVGWLVLPVFLAGFNPFLIFLASFTNKKAFWKHTKLDYSFGFFSFMALILWWITKEPNIAILFAIISDLFAAGPTYKKAWTHPESESSFTFFTSIIGQLSVFLVLESAMFSEVAFPLFLLAQNALIIAILYRKKWRPRAA